MNAPLCKIFTVQVLLSSLELVILNAARAPNYHTITTLLQVLKLVLSCIISKHYDLFSFVSIFISVLDLRVQVTALAKFSIE